MYPSALFEKIEEDIEFINERKRDKMIKDMLLDMIEKNIFELRKLKAIRYDKNNIKTIKNLLNELEFIKIELEN